MTALTKTARPLAKLVPIIRKELKAGFQAGERHWKKTGRLLNEARSHFTTKGLPKSGKGPGWYDWIDANFEHPWSGEKLARGTVKKWMMATRRIDNGNADGGRTASLKSATDNRSPKHEDYNPKLDWEAGVRKVQKKIDPEQLKRQWEDEDRENRERAALARKIVDAGYRALAPMVHPDRKGGSREAMAKLTTARKWVEGLIRSQS